MGVQFTEEAGRRIIAGVRRVEGLPMGQHVAPPRNPRRMGRGVRAIICKTPAGGIAAMSGTTPGSATCDRYKFNSSGNLVNATDSSGSNISLTVYHIATNGAIAGSTWIQAKKIDGHWVADFEDCA